MRYGVICFLVVCYMIWAPGATAMRRQKRMAGGSDVDSDKYPWVVSIKPIYKRNLPGHQDTVLVHECTGSIIDIYGTVATAAHCVAETRQFQSESFTLFSVGVTWGSYVYTSKTGYIVGLSNVIRHNGSIVVHRDPGKDNLDFALIFITQFYVQPIDCNKETPKPIELSMTGGMSKPPNGIVAGFGKQPVTNHYNAIEGFEFRTFLAELEFNYGGRGLFGFNEAIYYNESVHSSSMFHATGKTGPNTPYDPKAGILYSGTCQGDSGAPYMVKEDGKIRLRGVNVGAKRYVTDNYRGACTPADRPRFFTDINYPEIRNWMRARLITKYSEMRVPINGSIPRTC